MLTPHSSYSELVIHIDSNVEMEDMMDPPIHDVNFLSGLAITLTSFFIITGAKFLISFFNLSGNPLSNEVPPDKTIFLYKSFLESTSHFSIAS